MDVSSLSAKGVAKVFSLFADQYAAAHKLNVQQRKTIYAIENCRTAILGGHVETCNCCGHTRVFYNSCRNRHCPQCQGLKRERWVDKLASELLPVSYFHIVFTIPSQLNALALFNQECIYDILFKAASESMMMLAKDPKHLGVITGMVAVLHTWGQNLMDHPHLHTMIPAGGWDETAGCWKKSRRKFFISVKVISKVFRGKFLALLKTAYGDNQLKLEGQNAQLKNRRIIKKLLDQLYKMDWVVYAKDPFKKPAHLIRYLGRYTHRVAISNDRIKTIDKSGVSFVWKDYHDHDKYKTMELSGEEFIRRFLLHVLPKGFCKIRYYGIFACRNRKTLWSKCRKFFGYQLTQSRLKGLSWQKALEIVCGINVEQCPVCKEGVMVVTSVIMSKRAPPFIST
jgi:hypothetical protein